MLRASEAQGRFRRHFNCGGRSPSSVVEEGRTYLRSRFTMSGFRCVCRAPQARLPGVVWGRQPVVVGGEAARVGPRGGLLALYLLLDRPDVVAARVLGGCAIT